MRRLSLIVAQGRNRLRAQEAKADADADADGAVDAGGSAELSMMGGSLGGIMSMMMLRTSVPVKRCRSKKKRSWPSVRKPSTGNAAAAFAGGVIPATAGRTITW